MSNPLIDWEQNIIYLVEPQNIVYGKETQKQFKRSVKPWYESDKKRKKK